MSELPNYEQPTQKSCVIVAWADAIYAITGRVVPQAEVDALYHSWWFRMLGGWTGLILWVLFIKGKTGTFGRIHGTKDIRAAIDANRGTIIGVGGIHQIPAMSYTPAAVMVRNLYTQTGNAETALTWPQVRLMMTGDQSAIQFAAPGVWDWRIVAHGMIVNWWVWSAMSVVLAAFGYAAARII